MHYGLKGEELGLRIFDVMDINTKKFLDFDKAVEVCKSMELEMVPILYRGPYVPETIEPMCDGPSMIGNSFREGFVIKPVLERPHSRTGGRTVLKMVGQQYLLRKNGTEFH
jgi:ATP-dependent RNA circularization protein (DNA/RNA ligase family)